MRLYCVTVIPGLPEGAAVFLAKVDARLRRDAL